jgi:hypothetical protein
MARIVFGSYFARYPLGGMMSHVLQYLVGFHRAGHEVTFVERARYHDECFDPSRGTMTDDCSYGVRVASSLLERHGLGDRWCFVDVHGTHHGMDARSVRAAFATGDVFVDMGTHGAWLDEASGCAVKILLDGEPGYNQIRMEHGLLDPDRGYDAYVTNGLLVGTPGSPAPTAGRSWRHVVHPVVPDLFAVSPAPHHAPFTTVMNWRSHDVVEHAGSRYGQKDVEFERFLRLPGRCDGRFEVAVAGRDIPRARLSAAGWAVRDAHEVTASYDSFVAHVDASAGEFSVCKEVFVALRTGWFSDRSAVFLAAGRPVVLQDTGWSEVLPTGQGLFAVRDVEEAAAAVDEIRGDWKRHSGDAREIAQEHFDARVVLGRLVDSL